MGPHGQSLVSMGEVGSVERSSRAAGGLTGGVAFVPMSTESPHAARGDVRLTDLARQLRRRGCPTRVFQVYLDPSDRAENDRRVERLVERVLGERCRWVVFNELWTPELGRRLRSEGIGLIELRSHTFDDAIFADDGELFGHVSDCTTGKPLDEMANLVEIIGPRQTAITAMDLRVHQSCGFKRTLADNPFYRDVLDNPTVAAHRGCAHCVSAMPDAQGTPEIIAQRIVDRLRSDRKAFPTVRTFWMSFAETFYESLAVAFRTTRGDPVWQGITLAMQCRPDVIAQRAGDIEALAADADASGTHLRIGVVGFENFSPNEILVLNRGAAPEELDTAATILNRWSEHPPRGLVARGFTPSFILFTPWTRIEDLEVNLARIARHGLWSANIERLRVGPGTPTFEKARHDGLVIDEPVRSTAHPNGYTAERPFRYVDANVAAVSDGFERLRPLAHSDQPELLAAIVAAVRAARDPAALDWDEVARAWADMGSAARAS
jgi:hypothetical protein